MSNEEKEKYNKEDFKVIMSPDLKLTINIQIEFWLHSSISKLSGFEDVQLIIESNEAKSAKDDPKLRSFDDIEIHCSLGEPSITNHNSDIHKHDESKILYSFFLNVIYKQKISEKPNEIHYVPIRKGIKQIKGNIISILDERGNLLKNEGANYIIYLNLKAL